MREYDRDEYDDYEDDGYEQEDYEDDEEEEYEDEKEERKPTKEEIEYLELRQKLKENIRKKMKKESGSSLSISKNKQKRIQSDSYGSFFGPSQPVISQRVIQETKSLLENQHLTSKLDSSSHNKKSSAPSTSGSKPVLYERRPPKVNEVERQLQKRRETRDYSFLLSDDAEIPAPSGNPPQRSLSTPKSDARPAQVPLKNKQPLSNGSQERRPVYSNGASHSKAVSQKMSASQSNLKSIVSGKPIGSNNGVGLNRLSRPNSLPPKTPSVPERRPSGSTERMPVDRRPSGPTERRPSGSTERRPSGSTDRRPSGSTDRRPPSGSSERRPPSSMDRRPPPSVGRRPSSSVDRRPPLGSSDRRPPVCSDRRPPLGSSDRRPPVSRDRRPPPSVERRPPSSMDRRPPPSVERRPPSSMDRRPPPASNRPSSSKMQTSHPKQHLEQRKGLPDPNRAKSISKQPLMSSKPQTSRPQPKAIPSRSMSRDDRPKKRPSRPFSDDDDDDGEKALSMIRKMFNTKRYQDIPDDDSDDMEAGFDEIMAEEKRSARIARKEDEEQLRLIEEEERRERMRKLKKQKLSR